MEKIKEFFKEEYLSVEEVYESKEKYNVIFINSKLYEEIFEEEYEWEKASKKIENMFSITLDENKSNGNKIGEGFADMQEDPFGIALSNNLGSGRAFFYGSNFNIKGEKTKLAISPKSIYSNGKYALSAAIKETIISNILSKDFIIPSFESLAILEKKEKYTFLDEYLDEDDKIKQREFNLPCAIEIRYYREKELYRISNSIINKDLYTEENIKELAVKIAKIEANKFIDRFLHGSWSSGNITTEGNLIDFDTSTFVKLRYPQYSNTFKYKSNFFGYELDGQKLMINSIIDKLQIGNTEELKRNIENNMNEIYNETIKSRFCDLIGLSYDIHYKMFSDDIDYLCKEFNILSRKFIPNYTATNIVENDEGTALFDFSNFFQKYLIKKDLENYNVFLGIQLLLNNTEEFVYDKIGFIKDKIEEFFKDELVYTENKDLYLMNAMKFVERYDELFEKIKKEFNIEDIKLKQYIINSDRNYIEGNSYIYGDLSYGYDDKKIDNKTLNKIIEVLINTNLKNNYENKKEISLGLKLYDNYLTYWNVSKNYYYYLVLEPYSNLEIDFAKLILNDEELMLSHSKNGNGKIMISEKIYFEKLPEILENDIGIKINGK